MEIGDYGQYNQFVNGELRKTFMIQFIGETKNEYRFKFDMSDNEHLTVAKSCFPTHEWQSGDSQVPIKRKTIIEMWKTFKHK